MEHNPRIPEYNVDNLLINRWSPRSMTGETISDNDLMTILEAGKWAPSSRNEQPWRFIYAKRESEEWQSFVEILLESNQAWAKNASVLILIISKNTSNKDNSLNKLHSFDTGAAWANIALQTVMKGFVAHAMGGIDFTKAKSTCEVPDDYSIECMVAIGKQDVKEKLPDSLKEREFPSSRRPLKETVMKGKFS